MVQAHPLSESCCPRVPPTVPPLSPLRGVATVRTGPPPHHYRRSPPGISGRGEGADGGDTAARPLKRAHSPAAAAAPQRAAAPAAHRRLPSPGIPCERSETGLSKAPPSPRPPPPPVAPHSEGIADSPPHATTAQLPDGVPIRDSPPWAAAQPFAAGDGPGGGHIPVLYRRLARPATAAPISHCTAWRGAWGERGGSGRSGSLWGPLPPSQPPLILNPPTSTIPPPLPFEEDITERVRVGSAPTQKSGGNTSDRHRRAPVAPHNTGRLNGWAWALPSRAGRTRVVDVAAPPPQWRLPK